MNAIRILITIVGLGVGPVCEEQYVHFWYVPKEESIIATFGPRMNWEYGQCEPQSWEPQGCAPCVVCRDHGYQDIWLCQEGIKVWPKENNGHGIFYRNIEWLGQVPYDDWRAGVLGKRLELSRKPKYSDERVHRFNELVDILEARQAAAKKKMSRL